MQVFDQVVTTIPVRAQAGTSERAVGRGLNGSQSAGATLLLALIGSDSPCFSGSAALLPEGRRRLYPSGLREV
jgi:hypothetical protein